MQGIRPEGLLMCCDTGGPSLSWDLGGPCLCWDLGGVSMLGPWGTASELGPRGPHLCRRLSGELRLHCCTGCPAGVEMARTQEQAVCSAVCPRPSSSQSPLKRRAMCQSKQVGCPSTVLQHFFCTDCVQPCTPCLHTISFHPNLTVLSPKCPVRKLRLGLG